MITIACPKCLHALRVVGDIGEVDGLVGACSSFHPDKYACFQCGAKAECVLSAEVSTLADRVLTVHELTPQEAFAALCGMGIPEEMTCCSEVVEAMFEKQGIKVKGRQLPSTQRYVIDALVFPDGSTMHLGASVVGALAYRITKRHSYVRAVEARPNDG